MATDVNRVTLVGVVGADPHHPENDEPSTVMVGTQEGEVLVWHLVRYAGPGRHGLKRGTRVVVSGRLAYRLYETPEGVLYAAHVDAEGVVILRRVAPVAPEAVTGSVTVPAATCSKGVSLEEHHHVHREHGCDVA